MARTTVVRMVAGAAFTLCATAVGAQSAAPQPPAPGAPGGTRLLFGPSGRLLEPGKGYVTLDGLLLASLNVGVTPWLSMGGGTLVVPLTEGSQPFWIIPKVRLLSRGATSVALCVVHAVVADEGQLGAVYVASTTGSDENSVTLGGAFVYLKDGNGSGEDYTGGAPALLVGGERRIHPRWSLVTENYFHIEGAMLSMGFRLHRERFLADFGAIAPIVFDEGILGVFGPTVTIGWKF